MTSREELSGWVDCPECLGEEGWGAGNEWVECPTCLGEGGRFFSARPDTRKLVSGLWLWEGAKPGTELHAGFRALLEQPNGVAEEAERNAGFVVGSEFEQTTYHIAMVDARVAAWAGWRLDGDVMHFCDNVHLEWAWDGIGAEAYALAYEGRNTTVATLDGIRTGVTFLHLGSIVDRHQRNGWVLPDGAVAGRDFGVNGRDQRWVRMVRTWS